MWKPFYTRRKALLLWLAMTLALYLDPLSASLNAQNLPTYDISTIKQSIDQGTSYGVHVNDNTYIATNVTLEMLLHDAYGIREPLILGIPKEMQTRRYDITAKSTQLSSESSVAVSFSRRKEMLKALLLTRFSIVDHTESRPMEVYELSLVKGRVKLPAAQDAELFQGVRRGGVSIQNDSRLIAHGITMKTFAEQLSHQLDRTVEDRTGLQGSYDIDLSWTSFSPNATSESASNGIDLPAAVRNTLGLRITKALGNVPVLVIDSVQSPTPN